MMTENIICQIDLYGDHIKISMTDGRAYWFEASTKNRIELIRRVVHP